MDKDTFAALGGFLLVITVPIGLWCRFVIWNARDAAEQRPGEVDQWARENILAAQLFWWLALPVAGVGAVLLIVAGVMALMEL